MKSRTAPTTKTAPAGSPAAEPLTDEQLAARVLGGEIDCFEPLMRRYNQRLYRVARGILDNDGEAEDVVQDAFVRAYSHLDQFAGRARFSSWLTRIAVHEARARARRRSKVLELDALPEARRDFLLKSNSAPDPEQRAIDQNLQAVLEAAIGTLPGSYRVVLMLRDVEGLSAAATAECLGLTVGAVKTRLHRSRAMLHDRFARLTRTVFPSVFEFPAPRCNRVVEAVLARIGAWR